MKHDYLQGRGYSLLVRCSKDEQADTSPVDQGNILHEFARENGMIHSGHDVILEGVSASVPAARTDIDEIIRLKQQYDNFDVVLISILQ